MIFLVPWALAGLAMIALPVWLHRVRRSRGEPLSWGAMDFLEKATAASVAKWQWRTIVLLLLRVVLVLLLTLTMARPQWDEFGWRWEAVTAAGAGLVLLAVAFGVRSPSARRWIWGLGVACFVVAGVLIGWGTPKRSLFQEELLVVVVDRSRSATAQPKGQEPLVSKLERKAKDVIDQAANGVGVIVVQAGREISMGSVSDREAARELLESGLQEPAGVFQIRRVLEEVTVAAQRLAVERVKVVAISDGQRSGWGAQGAGADEEGLGWDELQELWAENGLEMKVEVALPEAPLELENVGITNLTIQDGVWTVGVPGTLVVTVKNSGTQASWAGEVEVLGTQGNPTKAVRIPGPGHLAAGETAELRVPVAFAQTGFVELTARLLRSDDVSWDNERLLLAAVQKPVRVLLIEGQGNTTIRGRAGWYLRAALMADAAFDVSVESLEVVETADQLAKENWDLVVLAEADSVPSKLGEQLARLVDDGAGLIVVPGPGADLESYRNLQKLSVQLLPGGLGALESEGSAAQTGLWGPDLPASVRTAPCFSVDLLPGAEVFLGLGGGEPWWVGRAFGGGRVALIAGGLRPRDGGSLVLEEAFPVLLGRLAKWTTLGREMALGTDSTWNFPRAYGLLGYYQKNWAKEPALVRRDRRMTMAWHLDSPGKGVPADNFKVRWEGVLTEAGRGWPMEAEADDTLLVKVDGVEVAKASYDKPTAAVLPAEGEGKVECFFEEHGRSALVRIGVSALGTTFSAPSWIWQIPPEHRLEEKAEALRGIGRFSLPNPLEQVRFRMAPELQQEVPLLRTFPAAEAGGPWLEEADWQRLAGMSGVRRWGETPSEGRQVLKKNSLQQQDLGALFAAWALVIFGAERLLAWLTATGKGAMA